MLFAKWRLVSVLGCPSQAQWLRTSWCEAYGSSLDLSQASIERVISRHGANRSGRYKKWSNHAQLWIPAASSLEPLVLSYWFLANSSSFNSPFT